MTDVPHVKDVNAGEPVLGTRHKLRVAIGSGAGDDGGELRLHRLRNHRRAVLRNRVLPQHRSGRRHAARLRHAEYRFRRPPAGRIIGGYLGDKIGRRAVLITSLLVMGSPPC